MSKPTKKKIEEIKTAELKKIEALQNENELMRAIMDDMKDLYRLLTIKMKQFGISAEDLEEIIKEPNIKKDFHQHSLIKTSRAYTKLATNFLDEFLYEQQKILHQFNIEVALDDVQEEIEVISTNHLILTSKCWNLLNENQNKSKNKVSKIYYLIKQSVNESESAIKSFNKKRGDQPATTINMIKLLNKIKREINKFKCN